MKLRGCLFIHDCPVMTILIPELAHTLAEAEAAIDRHLSDHDITVRLDQYGDPLPSLVLP
ncbi:hypothetical protein WJ85_32290 [Burkholderia ubonensis]|nr:hypothetical protein WJ85_32290 [Burkholderia ubonensis]KWC00266.1 hypothetical protein WL44_29950 [Burkholderia ubonensis]OJA31038.1 hypothetical protein BGV47_24715 [Burkholderia ubonensis]OJA43761.1 hypothetical protein BGV68_33430 [Burkholderia ubonensis]OJB28177.1 hypothetical protein BGV55_17575 [Burkholderia ubonensis]